MIITISPKDTTDKIELFRILHYQEGETFTMIFMDSRIRMYPMRHIWYIKIGE